MTGYYGFGDINTCMRCITVPTARGFNSLFLSRLLRQRTFSWYSWSIFALATSWLAIILFIDIDTKLYTSNRLEEILPPSVWMFGGERSCWNNYFVYFYVFWFYHMSMVFSNIKAHVFFGGEFLLFLLNICGLY